MKPEDKPRFPRDSFLEDEDFDFASVDQNNLDREWFRQANRMREACLLLSRAREVAGRAKVDEEIAKDDLKATYARMDLMVRKDPSAYGLEKATDKSAESTVLLTPEYVQALRNWRKAQQRTVDAERVVGDCEAAVNSLIHKRPALENGVQLWKAGYFADPRSDAGTGREMDRRLVERVPERRRDGKGGGGGSR